MYLHSTKEEATHVLMHANSSCGTRISHKALGLYNRSVPRNANRSVGEKGLLYDSELRLKLTSLPLEADIKVRLIIVLKKLLLTSAEAPIDIFLSIIY
jgi:hypothetical protein